MQREDQPIMTTELERIAARARCEPKPGSLDHVWLLRFVEHRGGDPPLIKARWPLQRLGTPSPAIPAVPGIRCAVNPSPKSVVREIRTLRSVGAGGG